VYIILDIVLYKIIDFGETELKGLKYTEIEIKYILDNLDKRKSTEMAAHLGRPISSVKSKIKEVRDKYNKPFSWPKHHQVTCKYCEKIFFVKQSIKKTTKYCSKKCMGEDMKGKQPEYLKDWKSKWPDRNLKTRATRIKNNLYNTKDRHPEVLEKLQVGRKRYAEKNKVPRVELRCGICGKEYTRERCKVFDKNGNPLNKWNVCSIGCLRNLHKNLTGKYSHMWMGGTIVYRGPNWIKQRQAAIKKYGNHCAFCGKEDNGNKDFSLHHIIPARLFDKDYNKSNKLSNLIPACDSCHMIVERYSKKHGHDTTREKLYFYYANKQIGQSLKFFNREYKKISLYSNRRNNI